MIIYALEKFWTYLVSTKVIVYNNYATILILIFE